jgi:hypothetical protein
MLNRFEILDAVRYNARALGRLWTYRELPQPLSDGPIDSEFVAWVCAFQSQHGLKVDGQLGPKTFGEIKKGVALDDVTRPLRTSSLPPPVVVDGKVPSNYVIINGKRVNIPEAMISRGYTATNYLDDGEVRFKHQRRTKALNYFVQHETCGNTAQGCKDNLVKTGYGVQLIMDPWGRISCHGDLVLDRMAHVNQLNNMALGCEVVNPYSPVYVVDEKLWEKRIPRQWWTWIPEKKSVDRLLKRKGWNSVPKEYICPTDYQIESMKIFCPWVVREIGLFPYEFPTAGRKKGSPKIPYPAPGVIAHTDVHNHADGRYMLELLMSQE